MALNKYPVGMLLESKRYKYKILQQIFVKKYILAYEIKNLSTGKIYNVAYNRIHSKTYWPAGKAGKILYGS